LSRVNLHDELLPHLFRQEYAKMTAVLCRHFGLKQIENAEDIASDTFLKASEHWAINGIPENPTAWLYTVATNKARDYFKHLAVRKNQIDDAIGQDETIVDYEFDFSDAMIADSQLSMIFAVSMPGNSREAQICLALQILCGFSVEEIANAFLSKTETIKKRLHRARTHLRNNHFQIDTLSKAAIESRLDTVLATLYLLFNEGYFSKTNKQLIRKELCSEALRLTLVLTEHPLTNIPRVNALLALICFQSSRLDARIDRFGETILFEKQDKNLWDKTLIGRGNYYLVNACNGTEVSRYHLEAGIAYWHTTCGDNKWQHILQLYNQLLLIDYSPVAALNRAFAFSKVYGAEKAISEVEKLDLAESNYYHELLGYLYADMEEISTAIQHYTKAMGLTRSKAEKQTIKQEIDRLTLLSAGAR